MLTKSFFNRSPFVGNQFVPLPLGAIRASGSMQEKLITLRAGLLSHVPSLVPEAGKDSAFFGGNLAGGLYAPRYLEALLLTSALLSDQELQQSALALVDLAVASQREDGAFGAKDESIEACAAMLRTVMTAYSLTGQKAYLTFVLRYFKYLSVFLKEHPLSDEDAVHTADVLAAGITLYNITGQRAILPVLDLLIQHGADFTSLFHAFPYKIPISRQIQSESESDEEDSFIAKTKQMSDGAVLCEGLRATALSGIITGSGKRISAAERGLASMNRLHGALNGGITADPLLAGTDPARGTTVMSCAELCASIETIFSCQEGTPFADQWEQVFYNGILSAFSDSMREIQHTQQANQVSLLKTTKFPFSKDGVAIYSYSNPDALCAILPVIPRFLMHQWMLSRDEGLCAMGYAPCHIRYRLKDTAIRIHVESDYPKTSTVTIHLSMDHDVAFPLRLRIPGWAEHAFATVEGDRYDRNENSFLVISRQWHDGDTVTLTLPMKPVIRSGYHQAVSIYRGPLLFCAPIKGKNVDGSQEAAQMEAVESFAHAIIEGAPIRTEQDETGIRLIARAVTAGAWDQENGVLEAPPMDVPSYVSRDVYDLILTPYAETVLRISAFPRA